MNVRATLAALLIAAAPISRANAQFDFKISYSNYTQFGALVTVDVRNTQARSTTSIEVLSQFFLAVSSPSNTTCFAASSCGWGPKSYALVGNVGTSPFSDRAGNTYTASFAGWDLDNGSFSVLGFGSPATTLGILGCTNPIYISPDYRAVALFGTYTARTCAAEGETGFVRFETFLTVQNEIGEGFDPSLITGDFVRVFYTTDRASVITPEPATYALMLGGLAVLGVVTRRRRVQ